MPRDEGSLETILTFENRDASQWSVVWSTAHIPGMDNAIGSGGRRVAGRRRLRAGSLALGALLAMHCRVSASMLSGGFFVFMTFLVTAVVLLANPLRHFEVYLGQWSISGPGRAFRIIPMFDGIGIAMCINALVRAINCCGIAAITAIYLLHTVSDAPLPFTYCRDWDLNVYKPEKRFFTFLRQTKFPMEAEIFEEQPRTISTTTVGLGLKAWRNISYLKETKLRSQVQLELCREVYPAPYPPLYKPPAYNYFYVEVVHLRPNLSLEDLENVNLVVCIVAIWLIIWLLMVMERMKYGRLVWNNIHPWIGLVPWIWVIVLLITAASNLIAIKKPPRKIMRLGTKDVVSTISDALETALYIHSASMGTELIHGKGLNHYDILVSNDPNKIEHRNIGDGGEEMIIVLASGHIDHDLNSENVWHSFTLVMLSGAHALGALMCSLVDHAQPDKPGVYHTQESTLWVIPMYSKCTTLSGYSHFLSSLLFGGLTFSYITAAYLLLKTALHTIFEYRVKLVFVEQLVVASLIFSCMGFSLLFATNGGIALLESTDAVMTGLATPGVCLLELVGLLYVYRSPDFLSDLNVATEDNACSTRITTQWQIIPLITLLTVIMKASVLTGAELPEFFLWCALAPLLAALAAVPLRAAHNAYTFLRPAPRHGT